MAQRIQNKLSINWPFGAIGYRKTVRGIGHHVRQLMMFKIKHISTCLAIAILLACGVTARAQQVPKTRTPARKPPVAKPSPKRVATPAAPKPAATKPTPKPADAAPQPIPPVAAPA